MNASCYSISITFLPHREPVRKFPMFYNPLYAFCVSNYSMKQLISWKTFQKWDKEVSLYGGLCSSAVGRGLCGIALSQVKFLGVVEMVPGARQARFVYTLYANFSYLSLQYYSLCLPSCNLHVHIPSRFLITSHKSAPCALYLLLDFDFTVACCPLVELFYFPCLSSSRSQLLGCADTWLATIIPVLWVSSYHTFSSVITCILGTTLFLKFSTIFCWALYVTTIP